MEKSRTKIVFMGTSLFAKEILAGLVEEGYNVEAVFTRPDKKIGREQKLNISSVKEIAAMHSIQICQPDEFNAEIVNEVKILTPDIIVVTAYGKILPRNLLEIPTFGCLNIHASLLPKYRGPSPIQNALLNDDQKTGVTLIKMDSGIDTGDILSRKEIPIEKSDNAETLSKKLSMLGKSLLLETLPLVFEKKVKPQKQDEQKATFCQLIEREDGHIFWNEEARVIYNKFRALFPWPGIFTFCRITGKMRRLKLCKISIDEAESEVKKNIGEVFEDDNRICIQAAKGKVILEEVQLEGKKPMTVKELLMGYPKFIGIILS